MNTNKAPDKIYVARYNGESFSHSWTMEPLGDTTATEYIRKEALIELINKKLQESADRLDYGTNKAYAEILDKLNEM